MRRRSLTTPASRARGLAFRAAAVLFGLLPFLLVECILALLGWGIADDSHDPFIGFHSVRPLFVPNEDGTLLEIDRSRQAFFRPASFARKKEAGQIRIFCLGGSTVQGRPFAVETSWTTWLELSLQAAEPTRDCEVINCGGVSYASYRLVPILQEVLRYKPDLIILYTGHNEFLEDRTYAHIKRVPSWLVKPCSLLMKTRTVSLLREGLARFRSDDQRTPEGFPVLPAEVDAVLDYRCGLDDYHRDEKWRSDTIEHFRFNLRRLVDLSRQADVPILIVNPVSNLRDCAPFKSQHRDGLTATQLRRWNLLVDGAVESDLANRVQAVRGLREALQIDDQYAGLHYRLARNYDALGQTDLATRHYLLAKETDICPLRMLEPMHDDLIRLAESTDGLFVDVRQGFEAVSRNGIPDGGHLLDHVHPSIEGHKQIAAWIMEELAREGFVQPVSGWERARDEAFRSHFESLDDLYFQTGVQRLETLRRWTKGQADGVRGATPATRP